MTDDNSEDDTEIESDRGIDAETKHELEAEYDCSSFEELYEETDVLDQFRFPEADEAREFFDSVEQASEIELEVTLGDYAATIVGEVGYRWTVIVQTPGGGVEEVVPEYELAIEGGHIKSKDRGMFMVEYLGLWSDHTLVYERVQDLLEQVNNLDTPTHRQQALRWHMKDHAPVRSSEATDTQDSEGQEA